jgi:hypothetical protein
VKIVRRVWCVLWHHGHALKVGQYTGRKAGVPAHVRYTCARCRAVFVSVL